MEARDVLGLKTRTHLNHSCDYYGSGYAAGHYAELV